MARFTTNLTVTTPTETLSATKAGDYDIALKLNAEVDSSDTPITLVSAAVSAGTNTLRGCKALTIRNAGSVGVEIVFKGEEWADAANGDVVKFSVMSYTVDSGNGSTSGNLSSGVENCASPSTITGAGREQAYYQALTVSRADVDAGKVICAFVAQNGTNSDLTVNMQLVYHLR